MALRVWCSICLFSLNLIQFPMIMIYFGLTETKLFHFHSVLKNAERRGFKVSKGAKTRNRYNQVPHLTQDTNGKVTNSQ